MSTSEILKLWLTEACDDRRRRAHQAADGYERMVNKTATYAQAMRTLAIAHHDAASVYAEALKQGGTHE